jgi:hypothetical protein
VQGRAPYVRDANRHTVAFMISILRLPSPANEASVRLRCGKNGEGALTVASRRRPPRFRNKPLVTRSLLQPGRSGQFARTLRVCHSRRMKRRKLLYASLGMVLTASLSCSAQEKGTWRAESSTAKSITGDVALSAEKLAINFSSFPIAQIRLLKPAELSAAFDAESGAGGSGNLYRLSIPASKRFQHHNTLCGDEETQWMATYAVGDRLQIAFFSNATMPVFTPDALANNVNLCGTFSYSR